MTCQQLLVNMLPICPYITVTLIDEDIFDLDMSHCKFLSLSLN